MAEKVDINHGRHLASQLYAQKKAGKYCNICIIIGEKRFLAHKAVLSANSSKLEVLMSNAIGLNSSSQDIEMEIQGVSPMGFEALLEYFYTGKLSLQPHTVLSIYMTAAYLELNGVVEYCNNYGQYSVATTQYINSDDCQDELPDIDPAKNVDSIFLSDDLSNPSLNSLEDFSLADEDDAECILEITLDDPDLFEHQHDTLSQGKDSEVTDACQQVENLRFQHRKLQLLKERREAMKQRNVHNQVDIDKEPPRKKRKSTPENEALNSLQPPESLPCDTNQIPDPTDGDGSSNNPIMNEVPDDPGDPLEQFHVPEFWKNHNFRKVTPELVEAIYNKYSLKREKPIETHCSAQHLYLPSQPGKKSIAQNAMHNTIRRMMDALKVVESCDPDIEDACILVMDRFKTLHDHWNNPNVQRMLLQRMRVSLNFKRSRYNRKHNLPKIREGRPKGSKSKVKSQAGAKKKKAGKSK